MTTPPLAQAVRIIRLLLVNPGNSDVAELAQEFLSSVQEPAFPTFPRAQWTKAAEAPPSPQAALEPASDTHGLGRGNAPYGKVWAKDSRGRRTHLEDHPREQRVLARMGELREAGMSYSQVIDVLNSELPEMAPRDAPKWNTSNFRVALNAVRKAGSAGAARSPGNANL